MYLYGIYNGYEILLVGVGGQVKVNGTWEVAFGAREVERLWVPCSYKSSKHLTYWITKQQECTDMHIYG